MLNVGTIRQIQKELVENGYCVAENALRNWVKSGQIPAVYSGTTAYVSYSAILAFLTAAQSNQSNGLL